MLIRINRDLREWGISHIFSVAEDLSVGWAGLWHPRCIQKLLLNNNKPSYLLHQFFRIGFFQGHFSKKYVSFVICAWCLVNDLYLCRLLVVFTSKFFWIFQLNNLCNKSSRRSKSIVSSRIFVIRIQKISQRCHILQEYFIQ